MEDHQRSQEWDAVTQGGFLQEAISSLGLRKMNSTSSAVKQAKSPHR